MLTNQNKQFQDGHDVRMGFFEHLMELRDRLFKAVLALLLGTIIGFVIAPQALDYLLIPYAAASPGEQTKLLVTGPTGSIVAYFRVSLLIGGIISIPLTTYQVMMFVLPGLTRKEKKYVLMSLPAITLLFLVGVLFSWFILLPQAIMFLENFQSDLFNADWRASEYLSFITSLLFWMGVAFETPLIFFVLSLIGLVSPRPLIRNWRAAIVGAAMAAAIITPTIDPVNMGLVMAPLIVLYVISIFLVMIGQRIGGHKRK